MVEEEIADAIVEGIVEAAFSLKSVTFTEGSSLEEESDDIVVAAERCLQLVRLAISMNKVLTRIRGV